MARKVCDNSASMASPYLMGPWIRFMAFQQAAAARMLKRGKAAKKKTKKVYVEVAKEAEGSGQEKE